VDGISVEEKLFRERGFARVGVGDDGEGAAAGDFSGGRHEKRVHRTAKARTHDKILRGAERSIREF
jgi:hypothetical protein